jgi:hypothetical protein
MTLKFYSDQDYDRITDQLDNIVGEATIRSNSLLEPKQTEYDAIRKIIVDFIKTEKVIVYGGSAMDAIIRLKNKDVGIYNHYDRADIEWYDPNPVGSLIKIANRIDDAGYKYIQMKNAQHENTFTLFTNFIQYCDATYIPLKLFNEFKYIEIDGIRYIDPEYALIDYNRIMTNPLTSYFRLNKVVKRMKMLMQNHQFEFKNSKPIKFEQMSDHGEIIDFIMPKLADKYKDLLYIGQLAYQVYIYPNNKNIDSKSINQIEMITDKANEVGKFIKSQLYVWCEKKKALKDYDALFDVKFFNIFFQYWDRRSVIYYKGQPIFTILGNNHCCLPYNTLSTSFGDLKIGSFILTFNYYLIGYQYESILKYGFYFGDRQLINSLLTARNEYLSNNNKTVLDQTIYKEFILDCVGETSDFTREYFLRLTKNRDQGIRTQLSYDPKINRGTYVGYNFEICDGSEIREEDDDQPMSN